MSFKDKIANYFEETKSILIGIDILKWVLALAALIWSFPLFSSFAMNDTYVMVFHRRLINDPAFSKSRLVYYWLVSIGASTSILWLLTVAKNFLKFTVMRGARTQRAKERLTADRLPLPPYPYSRESFAVVLAELQDRDGSRVPNPKSPDMMPRWLILPEKTLFTGIFCTGAIGSGKTSALAEPVLRQMIGHVRQVPVRIGGKNTWAEYKWSGLVTDEKGDFCALTEKICKEWGREKDFIRIAPKGKWKWNVIYNPIVPTWATGYTLSKIIKRFNKGASGGDPFWDNAPQELLIDYLTLLDDAEGYYSISSYLEVLIDARLQDQLTEMAVERWADDPARLLDIERRARRIASRREDLGQNLMGSLQACAKAGLSLFDVAAIRETFCPTREEYFADWFNKVPRDNIFTGFDAILDRGVIVGLEMSKHQYYSAAEFIQIAIKAAHQDAVLRREARQPDGSLLIKPLFGDVIGHCPTFIIADECQESVDPGDQKFMALCRSKKCACVWLTQSHTSIIAAMGSGKAKDAEGFFQGALTKVYFRQSDLESMKIIEKEAGIKDVAMTSVAITEGGQQSKVDYAAGDFVHDGLSVSETKTVQIQEKPFFETEQLKQLPDYTAVIMPSSGATTLPATIGFTRPDYIFEKYPDLKKETSWHDWPPELRHRLTLENVPQSVEWEGWDLEGPVDLDEDNLRVPSPAPALPRTDTAPDAGASSSREDNSPSLELDKAREAPKGAPDLQGPVEEMIDEQQFIMEGNIAEHLERLRQIGALKARSAKRKPLHGEGVQMELEADAKRQNAREPLL